MIDFKKMKIWERSHRFVLSIYEVTKSFPKEELYGITSQLRKASLSIPNNIAEGCGRNSVNELNRFLTISMGSASEVEYLLLLCWDLTYLTKIEYNDLNDEINQIKKMMSKYSSKIRQNSSEI